MSNRVNRREFVRSSGLLGASVGLALGGRALAESAPNQTVVVGVMGMGRGGSLAQTFARQPGVEVKYLCDVDLNRANSATQMLSKIVEKAPTPIQDFRRVLDDKTVNVLVCAAPNHWHAPATILACSAGKHVYVEKPCCHNPHEGELMVQAARKNKRAVQMGNQRRSGEKIVEAMQAIRDGAIGRVYFARSWYASLRGSMGQGKPASVPEQLDYDLWQGPAPRRPYLDNVVHYNWHWRWHWGNGELGNNGIHSLDLCRWGLGVDFPIAVTSTGGRYRFDDDQETADTHSVGFEFAGGKAITWEGLSCSGYGMHGDSFGTTFHGDAGTIHVDNWGYTQYDMREKEVKKNSPGTAADFEHVANFIAAIRNDKPLELNAEIEEGYKSTLLCHLGNIAHRTGRKLHCNPENGHVIGDKEAMAMWSRDYESGWEPKV